MFLHLLVLFLGCVILLGYFKTCGNKIRVFEAKWILILNIDERFLYLPKIAITLKNDMSV